MESFMNNYNRSVGAFNRRENDIQNINDMGAERYDAAKAMGQANYNAAKQQVASANEATQTQTGIETGFAGVGAEPLLKGAIDASAKNLYAAGKAAKATRLGQQADAIQAGDTEAAAALEQKGATELAADAMDSQLAQNAAAVLKAPGQAISKVGDVVGDAGKAIGKQLYRGGQAIKSKLAPQFRNRGDATNQEGTELEPVEPTEPATTETSFGGGEVAPARGNIPQESLARNTTTETPVEDLPAQGGQRAGQAVEQRTLESAGEGAQDEADTLVTSTGREVGSAAADASGEAGAAGASSGAAAGAAEAGAGAAETAGATAGEVAADAAAASLDAAALASESIPGVGTVVGGLLAIGGGLAALFGGAKHHQSKPKPPPPPPPPTKLGVSVSEAAPVMDSSIYRSTGYNQLS